MTKDDIEKLPVIELFVDDLLGDVFDVREVSALDDRITMLADRFHDGQPVDPILVAIDRQTVIDGRTRLIAAKRAQLKKIRSRISPAPNMAEKIFQAAEGNSQTALPLTAGDMAKTIEQLRRLGVSRGDCQERLGRIYAKARIRQLLQEDAREEHRRKVNRALIVFKANRCDPDKTAIEVGQTPGWVIKHCTKQTQGKKAVIADSSAIQEKSSISGAHKREYSRIYNLYLRLNEEHRVGSSATADILEVMDYQKERLEQLRTFTNTSYDKLNKRLSTRPK